MNSTPVIIGADHAGFELKQQVISHLRSNGYLVTDMGTNSTDPVDYPDIAIKVASAVAKDSSNTRGILICASGIGMSMVANRVPGILAGQVFTPEMAKRARHDDNINILCLSSAFVSPDVSLQIVDTWLETVFSGLDRHINRLNKIKALDNPDKSN